MRGEGPGFHRKSGLFSPVANGGRPTEQSTPGEANGSGFRAFVKIQLRFWLSFGVLKKGILPKELKISIFLCLVAASTFHFPKTTQTRKEKKNNGKNRFQKCTSSWRRVGFSLLTRLQDLAKTRTASEMLRAQPPLLARALGTIRAGWAAGKLGGGWVGGWVVWVGAERHFCGFLALIPLKCLRGIHIRLLIRKPFGAIDRWWLEGSR